MKLNITRKMFSFVRESFILRADCAKKLRIGGGLDLCKICTVSNVYIMMMTKNMYCQNHQSNIKSAIKEPVTAGMFDKDPCVKLWPDIQDHRNSRGRKRNAIVHYPSVSSVSPVMLSDACCDISQKKYLFNKTQFSKYKYEKALSIKHFKMILFQSQCRNIGNNILQKVSLSDGSILGSRKTFNWLVNCCSNQQHLCWISTTSNHSQVNPSPSPRKDAEKRPRDENKRNEPEEEILKSKKKIWEQNIWTIPNFLTVSRICLTPYLGYLVVQQDFALAGGLFVFAGFTDMLDGQIARTWPSQKSAFGSALDPLADKILIGTLYITLSVVDLIPVPLTALIFARDVCLIAAAFYVRYLSLPPPLTLTRFFDGTNVTMQLKPTTISKVNTAVQFGLVCATMAAPIFNYVDHTLLHALWYITAGTTIWSGLGYVLRKDTYEIYQTTQEAKTKYK